LTWQVNESWQQSLPEARGRAPVFRSSFQRHCCKDQHPKFPEIIIVKNIRLCSAAHSTQLSPVSRDRQGGPAAAPPPGHRNYCSSCNAEIMPDARFCRMCGKKFEAHWSQAGDWVMHV